MDEGSDRRTSDGHETFSLFRAHALMRVINAKGLLQARSYREREQQAFFVQFECDEWRRMMARGKGQVVESNGNSAPKFIDVKLTLDEKKAFREWELSDEDMLAGMATLLDGGIRIGVAWSGEQQAYFVSLTGREGSGANKGLCMTSFAKDLRTGIALALFKHFNVTEGDWKQGENEGGDEFG